MTSFRSKLARRFPGFLANRYGQLALLVVPCVFALLLGMPLRDGNPAQQAARESQLGQLEEDEQRAAPSFVPVGLVWGVCCASVFGVATLAGPLKRAVTRRFRHGGKRHARR